METKTKRKVGFALLDSESRQRVARLGGEASARKGTGHKYTSEEGRAARLAQMARGKKA